MEVNGIETRSLQTADQCSTTDLRRLSNCLMLAAEQIIYQKYSLCHEFLSDFQKLAIELFTVIFKLGDYFCDTRDQLEHICKDNACFKFIPI